MMSSFIITLTILCVVVFVVACVWGQRKKRQTNKDIDSSEPVISPFDYHCVVHGRASQLLESIHIISTTKNPETLSGRIEFINQIYDNFIPASKIDLYPEHMAEVIAEYKDKYYDRELTDEQVGLLLSPSNERIQLFYSDCAIRFYERYIKHQTAEINGLKTNAAKTRRRIDMVEMGLCTKLLFTTNNLPNIGHLDKIAKLQAGVM